MFGERGPRVGLSGSTVGSGAARLYFRRDSLFGEGFPLPERDAVAGTDDTQGDSDHLSVSYMPGETRGRSFQTGPFSVSLVLCLIARLAPPDKAALSLDR